MYHHFFCPPSAFCTLPPIAPSGLKFLPIMPWLESGPPTFSPTLPMAPSLVKAPPMAPFASKAAGAVLVSFAPLEMIVSTCVIVDVMDEGVGGVDVRGNLVVCCVAAHCYGCGFGFEVVVLDGDVLAFWKV
jgi:hypothetical protein